jgi:hypothetical protein
MTHVPDPATAAVPDPATDRAADPDQLYSLTDLRSKLGDFEAYLTAEDLAPSARFTYVDQAGRFVRWLGGQYRPRNAAQAEPRSRHGPWAAAELVRELTGYRAELEGARMQPLAIRTYVGCSEMFVRWLGGQYTARGPHGAAPPVDEDDSWLDESAVQQRLVRWLESEGWTILRQAMGREHGTDIDAERDGELMSIEVKGYPRRIHTFGVNKGKTRTWHPAAQARTYYGNALHSALTMLHADPTRGVAIALPDVQSYRLQFERSRTPLTQLGIRMLFVDRNGRVTDG